MIQDTNPDQQIFSFLDADLRTLERRGKALEADLEKAKKEKVSCRKIEEKIQENAQNIKAKKRKYKLEAYKMEQKNDDKLILVMSNDEWYKMTGRTAIFFMTDIVWRMKSPTRFHLKPDTDAYGVSEYGVVSIRIDEDFVRELRMMKILEVESKVEGIVLFQLPWKYTDKRIERIYEKLEKDKQTVNKIVMPKNMYPELCVEIENLMKMVYFIFRAQKDPVARDVLARPIVEHAANMSRRYIRMANEDKDPTEGLKVILKNNLEIVYSLKSFSDLNLIRQKDLSRIGTQLTLITRMIKKELRATMEKARK